MLLLQPLLALTSTLPARAQNDDLNAIRRIIRAETEAYYSKNADAWQATWIQDSTAARTIVAGGGGFRSSTGWDKWGPQTVQFIKENPTPVQIELQTSNYAVYADGSLAWAEYDQRITTPSAAEPYVSREQRGLVKRSGQWRIVSGVTEDVSSFGASPQAVEFRLNGTGRALLGAKRVQDAIEVFKLNVRLFPKSFNVYHSLGEAYGAAGDNKLAIEMYERSLALNPKNELARTALAKLRATETP